MPNFYIDINVVYDETPEEMALGVVPLLESGADHICAFRFGA